MPFVLGVLGYAHNISVRFESNAAGRQPQCHFREEIFNSQATGDGDRIRWPVVRFVVIFDPRYITTGM